MFSQLKATSIRDQVGQQLRQALRDRRFVAGQSISEAGLAAEMGISRGPVREALLLLAQEGLVTHSHNRGFSVVNFTDSDLAEISSVRLPLEILALDLAAGKTSEPDLVELDVLCAQIVDAYAKGELVACACFDMAFHSLIWRSSGNTRLASTLQTLLAPFFAYGALFSAKRPALTPDVLHEEHACFIRFLRGEETRSSEECVRFHLGVPTCPL